jgi:predicted Holliday junction resolvase-like endonuclease
MMDGEQEDVKMSRFRQAVFLSMVVSLLVAVMIALMRSQELRRKLSKRLEELWNALPVSERLQPSAQQAATKVRATGSALDERVQPFGSRVRPLRQEGISTAEPPAPSLEPSEFSGETEVSKGDA